jgi:ricin-type beta-trefoil lectin protein/alginate lyase/type IX secretion system substrate protein
MQAIFFPLGNYLKKLTVTSLLLLSAMSWKAQAQAFVHPGLLHKQTDFDRMKARVNASAQPWLSGYNRLTANSHSSLNYVTGEVDSIFRGYDGVHAENYARLFNDAAAAYATAVRWKVSGDNAYANKSIAILNAWSSRLKYIGGTSDKYLAAGIYGYQMANAAEIMRTYSGWASADFTRFQNMMMNLFYPMSHDFLVNHNGSCISHYWAAWDICNMLSVLSIGVLCDNRTLYNEAVDYFKNGAGNGNITKTVYYVHSDSMAQWQESGRDQGHTILGVGMVGTFCEMAWNQGDDLYSYDNNRFLKGAEYVAKYNLGFSVPYVTYNNCDNVNQTVISTTGRGEIRPIWELIYNHYVRRKGLPAPNITKFAQQVRAEGGGGDYGPNSGGFDQLGYGTLTQTLDSVPVASGTYRINARHSGKALTVTGANTANGTYIEQRTYASGTHQQWTVTHLGNSQYSIIGVASGKAMDIAGASTADGARLLIWPYSGNNNQRYTFTEISSGYYRITPIHSGKSVDVSGGSTADGAIVQQWAYGGYNNQQWQFASLSGRMATTPTPTTEATIAPNMIYPNPVVNRLTVQLNEFKQGATLSLFDQSGRLISTRQVKGPQYMLDVSRLVKGMYFIKLSNGTKTSTLKIEKR